MKIENRINLDDIIKIAHIEVLNDLIPKSADVLTKDGIQSDFDPEKAAKIISEQYELLFSEKFTKKYHEYISDKYEVVNRLEEIIEQLEVSRQ